MLKWSETRRAWSKLEPESYCLIERRTAANILRNLPASSFTFCWLRNIFHKALNPCCFWIEVGPLKMTSSLGYFSDSELSSTPISDSRLPVDVPAPVGQVATGNNLHHRRHICQTGAVDPNQHVDGVDQPRVPRHVLSLLRKAMNFAVAVGGIQVDGRVVG